jgi:CBS-domain-containing membrane protein
MTELQPPLGLPTARDLMKEWNVHIPFRMSVSAAAGLLEAAQVGVAPVVDYRGRCVGLFTVGDYRRWWERGGPDAEEDPARQAAPGTRSRNEVRYHMTRRFAVATPETDVPELLHRLSGGTDPFLVVLDRHQRPRGMVFALDVLLGGGEFHPRW